MKAAVKEVIKKVKKGEVPDGYNQTEIGVIPEKWELKRFGDVVAEMFSGATPYRGNPEYYEGNIRWITSGELNYNIINDTKEKITEEAVKKTNLKILPKGTFLMAITGLEAKGTRGSCGIVGKEATTNQSCMALIPSDKLLTEYLYHFYVNYGEKFAFKYCQGTKQQSYTMKTVKLLPINLPSLQEQQKITKILFVWDKAIELKEQLIETKKKQKKILMKKLLTAEVRLTGFDGEWKEVKLGDVFERVTRKNTDGNTNVLTMSAQRGLINQEDFFNKSVASSILDNYFLLLKGEFAYNKSYSNGYPMGAIKRLNQYDSGVVTTLYICFRLINSLKFKSNYYEHYFDSGLLNEALTKIAKEGGRAHGLLNVTSKDFFNLTFKTPGYGEQCEISEVLSTIGREIDFLEQELKAIKLQKKGLMELLLSGIVRVQC